MCTCVIAFEAAVLVLTRYSSGSSLWALVIIGITQSVFLIEVGVCGVARATQKSSANLPDLYPCLVIGAESRVRLTCFPLPFSPPALVAPCSCISGIWSLRHTNCFASEWFVCCCCV